MDNPTPQLPDRIFGTLAVHEECAITDCQQSTAAAVPTSLSYDTGVYWLCEEHADMLPWFDGLGGRRAGPRAYNLSPTCRYNSLGADLPPCGGAADYLAIIADDSQQLAVVSLCERHAKGLSTY